MANLSNQGRTAFITGANGFTGRYLTDSLRAAGWSVAAGVQGVPERTDEYPCNLEDPDQLAEVLERVQPDAIVHLAAISFVAHESRREIYRTNVIGTLNLMLAVEASRITPSQILIASSAAVYGNLNAPSIDESMCPQPATDYGISKLACEQIALQWSDVYPMLIVRPFNYTGVGHPDHFVIPKIVLSFARRDASLQLGNRRVTREYNDVRSVSRIYRQLLDAQWCDPIVNLCSGNGHMLDQTIEILSELAGYSPRIGVDPGLVRSNEIDSLVGDNRRLATTLGGVEFIPFQKTIRWMYEAATQAVRP